MEVPPGWIRLAVVGHFPDKFATHSVGAAGGCHRSCAHIYRLAGPDFAGHFLVACA